jgi:hypothetical protein
LALSSKPGSGNPIENASRGERLASAVIAAIVEESIPPERYSPTGTSALSRRTQASLSTWRNRPDHSCTLRRGYWPASLKGMSQYVCLEITPWRMSRYCPGISAEMPSKTEPGAGTAPSASTASSERRLMTGLTSPVAKIAFISEAKTTQSPTCA